MKYVFLPRYKVKEKDNIHSGYSDVVRILDSIYTEHKMYDIEINKNDNRNFRYKVIDNNGKVQNFQENSVTYLSFLELAEYRKMKLEKIREND